MKWKTILTVIPEQNRQKLLEYLQHAQNRDPTFQYHIEGKYIIIENPSKDIAYRRGQRLHYLFNVFYEVEVEKQNRQPFLLR